MGQEDVSMTWRRIARGARHAGRVGLVLLAWANAGMQGASAATIEFAQAHAVVTVDGVTSEHDTVLPYHWDRHHKGQAGYAVFDLTQDLPAVPTEPWGLYLPRLGNAYEIWVNGTLLQRQGNLFHPNGADNAQVPRYVSISPGVLQRSNQIRIHIRADIGRRGGLSQLILGPRDEVSPIYMKSFHWRATGSLLVVAFSAAVGLIGLALWLTQTGSSMPGHSAREPIYLYAALAELAWTFRVGDALIEDPPLPWPWWGLVPVAAMGIWAANIALFCIDVAGWRQRAWVPWFRGWLAALLVASTGMAFWALGGGKPLALTAWYAVLGLTFLVFGTFFLRHALRNASIEHRIVAATILLNVAVGLRDLYVFRINPSYADNSLIRYSSVLFGVALVVIVIRRFGEARRQAHELLGSLASRVAQKEAELSASYRHVEQLARAQERAAERTRILRDMHDGVGSHISAAIRQIQSGRSSQSELLQTLRDSLDQLKLSIDSKHFPPGDVTALLASLRYRLEPRFAASDIELQWDVDPLEPVGRLDAPAMRQLQFMVFEALSNVLQHARASKLRISATSASGGARLRVVDNGCGFDVKAPLRKGLLSMRERAQAIGASLTLHSEPGHTVVEIKIG